MIQTVTIKHKHPLYTKELIEASSIEMVSFEENGYQVVAQKGLYNVGDSAVFILPDSCVPNNELFKPFTEPQGDPSKSKLGKIEGVPCRVRSISFNMSLSQTNFKKVFSTGILFPLNVVNEFLNGKPLEDLGVTKYSEPDNSMGYAAGEWPENMYHTDETNVKSYPDLFDPSKNYYITRKVDGSSITIMKSDKYPQGFIGSRKVPQKIYDADGSRIKDCGGFVTYGFPILQKLLDSQYNNIALRGELCGSGFKGSGNKNNPDSKIHPKVVIYSADKVDPITNEAVPVPFTELIKILNDLGVEMVDILTVDESFKNLNQVIEACEEFFSEYQDRGMCIEGCVVRSVDSTVSFKVMNDIYDSKK